MLQVLGCPDSDMSLVFSSLSAVLIANAGILLCASRAQPPVSSLLSGTEINFPACLLSSTSSPLASSFSGALRHLERDGRSCVSNALHCSPRLSFPFHASSATDRDHNSNKFHCRRSVDIKARAVSITTWLKNPTITEW